GERVTQAQLDEASADATQLEALAHESAGQGVEHHVDALALGPAQDIRGEGVRARVRDVLDPLLAQPLSLLFAARGRVDLGANVASPLQRCLSNSTGRRVDQHTLTGPEPGNVGERIV